LNSALVASKKCLEVILAGFRDAADKGVTCAARLIASIKRDKDPTLAEQVVANAISLKAASDAGQIGGVVGVDFCGVDTHNNPFNDAFAACIEQSNAAGLAFVPHFAELSGEKDLQAILAADPQRLGHAVFMDEEPAVGMQIRERKIAIECCLVNNLNTMCRDGHLPKASTDPPGRHHRMFLQWIAEGQPLALCTDNRTHTGSLSDNYLCAVEALRGTPREKANHAWRLAADAAELILGGEEQKRRLRRLLFDHPWRPSPSL